MLQTHDPHLNLAIEEFLLENSDDDVFMLWQNSPTVVIGRNQNAYAEINSGVLRQKGIKLARRITGGGAVYHDLGNLNYTFISSSDGEGINFAPFTAPIIDALDSMGVKATLSGRNDILVGDKKISGNAQRVVGGRVLHHGTILFDSDLTVLSDVLSVDPEKISSKALKSVRSRVTNIRELLSTPMTVGEFAERIAEHIIKSLNAVPSQLPTDPRINELAARNASDEWLYPNRKFISDYTLQRKKRYPFGSVSLSLSMRHDTVVGAEINGDFFGSADLEKLEKMLEGRTLDQLPQIIKNIDIKNYIHEMTADQLIELINEG